MYIYLIIIAERNYSGGGWLNLYFNISWKPVFLEETLFLFMVVVSSYQGNLPWKFRTPNGSISSARITGAKIMTRNDLAIYLWPKENHQSVLFWYYSLIRLRPLYDTQESFLIIHTLRLASTWNVVTSLKIACNSYLLQNTWGSL